MVTLMPRPLHPGQVRTAPAFPPALPKICSMLFRLSQENQECSISHVHVHVMYCNKIWCIQTDFLLQDS